MAEEEETFMSAEKIQEQTQAKIAEEEEKHAKETEEELKRMEEERANIQADLDQKDKQEHTADLALDE